MTEERKQQLFDETYALVYTAVERHWGKYYVERDDLIQEGMMELWRCMDRYDETRAKASFATYAFDTVFAHLNRYVHRYRYGEISRTSTFQDSVRLVKYAKQHDISLDEAGQELNSKPAQKKYAQIINMGENLNMSLSMPVVTDKDDSTRTLQDIIPMETDFAKEICDKIDEAQLKEKLYKDFVNKEARRMQGPNKELYRAAVTIYLDTIFIKKRTLSNISEELGVSREMVRQYFMKFKKDLCVYLKKNKLLACFC